MPLRIKRTEEMAPSVRARLKREDLGSTPRTHVKSQVWCSPVISVIERWEGEAMESLEFAGQLAWPMRDTVSFKKGKLPEDHHSRLSSALHTHMHVCMHGRTWKTPHPF